MEGARNGTRHPTPGTTKTAKAMADPPDGGRPRTAAAATTTTVKGTEDPPSGDPERGAERIRLEYLLTWRSIKCQLRFNNFVHVYTAINTNTVEQW